MRYTLVPVVTFLMSITAWSQPSGQYVRIQTIQVKPDHSAEFAEVRRQVKAAYEKMNRKDSVMVYRDVGNNDYRITTTMDKLAGLDQPAGMMQLPEGQSASLRARIASYTTGSQTKIYRTHPELSVTVGTEMPKYLRTHTYFVKPGNAQKLIDLYKEAVPAAKSAGLKRLRASRLVIGGDYDEVRVTTGFEKFADLDEPSAISKGLGDKYQNWVERLRALVSHSEVRVSQFLPNLSHIVPAK